MFKIIKTKKLEEMKRALFEANEKNQKYQAELKETRIVLEIRVKAKIRQLKEEAQIFENKFEQRAKALKGKIAEFESFQKLMVNRELKMAELKRQIEESKARILELEGLLAQKETKPLKNKKSPVGQVKNKKI